MTTFVSRAADTSTDSNASPQLLVMGGAAIAALIFLFALRVVFKIISGIADFAERLVGGLVSASITGIGISVLGALLFVGYVVTVVLPGRST